MAPNPTIPTDPDAFVTDLMDDAKRAELLADPKKFGAFIRDYADAVNKRDTTIAEQTKDQVEAILAQWCKDNEAILVGNAHPGATPAIQPKHYNDRATGAKLDGIFDVSRSGAEFFQAMRPDKFSNVAGAKQRAEKLSKLQEIQNSFGSVVPADGGFLIPETLRAQLLQVALESAVIRPLATTIPMETLRVPLPMVDSTTNATSVFGGVIAYWTEESAALTESQASFSRVILEAKKLTAYAQVPNELPADASAFGGFIGTAFPQAIAWYEDVAFFKGTGVGEPLGFIGCPATITQAAEAGQGSGTIVWENVVKMYARMFPTSLNRAVWIADIATFPQLATMALSVGTGGAPIWLTDGTGTPRLSLLGRPVIFTEKANVLGTAGDLSFVDLSYYLIGDRQQMMAMSSEHYRFGNDQMAYRVIERVDGRPWLQSAITPQNGGNTLSAFVNLSSTRT